MGSSTATAESLAFEWSYDVFLSFRGEDTRSNFTSHLDMALRQKGINVFIDDKLKGGEQISETLFSSIQEALISIVIFSQNYASSSWCLDELVKIMECKKSKGQIVLPIFYKVDPSDIRKQTGSFGEALAKHQAKFNPKTQIWREALTTAANLSGWDLGTRKEADLIRDLVKEVLSILNRTCIPLYVAKYPVGIDSQLESMKLFSHNFFEKGSKFHYRTQHEYESDIGVYMVGIYGIGGLGKTTLAKALYNKIASQFEGCCFLSNVKEASKQFKGLVQLQENLLYEILKDDLKVVNLDRGINIIRNKLRSKKVLIVLDDVDKLEQLEALVGGRDWFGQGSKIIVTTRNKHLLSSHGFDEMHNILGLNQDEALELFSWHAFKESHPSSNYLNLSKRATSYCKGHPLALVVLGSFLCTRDQAECSSILDEFENSLSKDIKDILQLSFDGLEDRVKDIFLDISCLLVGEKVNYVKNMLSVCHLNLDFGIIILVDLSLITVEDGKVQMHDLIQQMGHKIVNGESSEPGKRSRLWLVQDILEVFVNNSGTDAVKAIKLELPNPTRLDVGPQAFINMKNLTLLIVRNAKFSTKIKYLPDSLKGIKWHGFAHRSLPSCFITKNLVVLDLQHSFIKTFGKRLKDCERLKHVDLSYSTLLEQIPDFSAASNLEELCLNNCTNLKTIDKSVFSLGKLTIRNLDGCFNLKKLPTCFFKLWSLKDLDLSYCKKLEKFPDFSASNLESLYLEECTNLRMIHESIGSLDKLVFLNLRGCTNLAKLPSVLRLKSLQYLYLSRCCKLESFPTIAENMKSLEFLYLDFTAIRELPSSIGYLTNLFILNLNSCTNLISLPNTIYLLKSLKELLLSGCSRFEMVSHKWDPTIQLVCSPSKMMETTSWSFVFPHLLVPKEFLCSKFTFLDLQSCNISNADFLEILCNDAPFLSDLRLSENKFSSLPSCLHKLMSLWNLELRNCKFLQEIPNLPQNIQNLDASGCQSLARSPDNIVDIISRKQDDLTLGEISREFILMNTGIPKWFSYKTKTNLINASFRHYPDMERSLAACVSFKVNGDSSKRGALISCSIFICNRLHCSFRRPFLPSKSEYMWLVTTSLARVSMEVQDWNKVLVWFEAHDELNVSIRSYGVHVTEELHGIQTDLKWQVVNYADFYQLEKLQNLDIEDLLLKRLFQEMSSKSNCKAMLHASYDPEAMIESKIQPMIFPLHVTYNGCTMICGMEGMGDTALANSLCNKFNWMKDDAWREALDNSTSFLQIQGREPRSLSWSPLPKRGDGKRGANITSHTISSKRGEDTRSNFTSHLHMALRQKGVNVFIDDDKLNRGEQISETLFKSIQETLICIVIFSENYASSCWCLEELVKIIESKKSKGSLVWPVFYKVDPSDVRKQTGSFGEALAKHQAKFTKKTQIWREALTTAAALSGWDLGTFRKEADLIRELVKEVLSILNRTCTPLYVAKYPVGIDSQLEFMKFHSHYLFEKGNKFYYRTQHEYESDIGVYMVGIYGIGGIGKTTLAKALYNKIANQFEGCCFLSNVREASKQFNGLVQLQESLLYEILKDDLKVVNLDRGINIIRNRLHSKKVLIVLDDVDKLEQLDALVGGHDWFGQGSKIIVTTRNKHLLSSHGFDEKHNIRGLNQDEALELFSWHAFKESHPSSNYLDLSERATSYCKGHPLALVVLGSFLCTRDQAEWSSILDEFENSQSKDIKDILQLSFDGLEDKVKDIFLDISCLLVGEKVNYVKNMLNTCHLNLDFGIIVLMDLSLITVENDKVEMHDLIQQMGHKIAYGESSEPGKRSRLWLMQDIWEVFVNNSGTDAVKAIKLEWPNPIRLDVDPQAFRNMKNLRLLIVQNAKFSSKIEYLPDSLKWIKWHGFAQRSLPSRFIMKNLVELDLQHSFIKKFGKRLKDCERLKRVDLSYSTLLEQLPDFSAASNLEELYLSNCTNLRTIDKSVFSLGKLTILNLDGCSNLKKLPTSYFMLRSLKELNLSHCNKLEKIPDFSAASNLERLYLEECTNLRMIHESIGSLDKLVTLVLRGCTNLARLPSYLRLKSLDYLGLSRCHKLENFPTIAENMRSLTLLDLDFTAIKELPSSIGHLTKLSKLNLNSCINLISLPNTIYLLKSLEELLLSGCSRFVMVSHKWDPTIQLVCSASKMMETASWSFEFPHLLVPKEFLCSKFTFLDLQSCNISNAEFLETLCNKAPFLSNLILSGNKFSSLPSCLHKLTSLWNLELRNCKLLQEIPNLPQNIQKMDATGCESLARSPDNIVDIISKKQDLTLGEFSREFLLTGIEIPEWFSYKTTTNLMSASFRHYPDMERTLAACVSFKVNGDSSKREALISCNIFICNRLHYSFTRPFLPSKSEYMWLVTTSLAWGSMEVKDWNKVLVGFEVHEAHDVTVRSCGVHVTEELHGIRTDLKWPVVNYADFYQLEKLPNLDDHIEASFVKRFFQEICCKFNCKAMLHAGSYNPETIDPKIQPMIFPLHVTYNGNTVIRGMEGMADTALANSLRNKFNWMKDQSWGLALDNSTSFYLVGGKGPWRQSLSYSSRRQHGDGETQRGTNITRDKIFSKNYLLTLETEKSSDIYGWLNAQPWISALSARSFGKNRLFIIIRFDISSWQ